MIIPFPRGELIYANNEDDFTNLFDGRQESQVPKIALRYLQLLSRLPNPDSGLIQGKYEEKKAAQATWDMPNLPE